YREVVGINTIKIIKRHRRQKTTPGGGDFLIGSSELRQGHAQLRIIISRERLDLLIERQRPEIFQIIYNSEVFVKVGKNEHRQLQATALHFELRLLQCALLLLLLKLRLDGIGVRHFASALEFLRDVEKVSRLGGGA